MATYSRSDTMSSANTTQQSPVLPSVDIGSILVKTLENSIDDKKDTDDKLTKAISDGINMSDLVKNNKDEKSDELTNLLKDTTSSNDNKNDNKKSDELSGLIKNKSSKEKSKTNSTVTSDSDKAAKDITGTIGKFAKGTLTGTAIAGIVGAKSIKDGAGKVVSGAGKVAGNLISKTGDIGGNLIANTGKLFGPVGNIVGKAVGTAVATPFKVVGSTITGAIGALGKIISTPLKEIMVKGGIIVAVMSQLFVFLEGLIAKFNAEKDMKSIEFMAKIESGVKTIPDRIKLSLEQVLSKVYITNPITGKKYPVIGAGLSEDEKKDYKNLTKKDENVKEYIDNEKSITEYEKQSLSAFNDLKHRGSKVGIDINDYDLNTEEGREKFKTDYLAKANPIDKQGQLLFNNNLDRYYRNMSAADDAKNKRNTLLENDNVARYADYEQRKGQSFTPEYFEKENEKLESKKEQIENEALIRGINKQQEKGDFTEYEANYARQHWGESVVNTANARYSDTHKGAEYQFATATGAEKFLQNEYKNWMDSWSKLFKDLKQDIGIQITQKVEESNSVSCRR